MNIISFFLQNQIKKKIISLSVYFLIMPLHAFHNNILSSLQNIYSSTPFPPLFLSFIGISYISFKFFSFFNFFYKKFLRSKKNLVQTYGENTWALITGASDGIGQAFCEELAQSGFNICLLARNREKLIRVEEQIKKINSKIRTMVVVSDLSKSYEEDFILRIEEQIKDIDISILVNNAGIADSNYFERSNPILLKEMILTNALAPVLLTRCIIVKMLARNKKSAVINLASFSASRPIPYVTVYGGTKAFDDYLARALAIEYQGKIDFMSLRPNWVSTKMSKKRFNKFDVITPNTCAKDGLSELGYETVTAGNWIHSAIEKIANTLVSDNHIKLSAMKTLKRIKEKEQKKNE